MNKTDKEVENIEVFLNQNRLERLYNVHEKEMKTQK